LVFTVLSVACAVAGLAVRELAAAGELKKLEYNHPGLAVDLGVGLWAWPLPMDFDADGDLDLVVACSGKPSNGLYFFENPGGTAKFPLFKPAVRLGPGGRNVCLSLVEGKPRLYTPGRRHPEFHARGIGTGVPLPVDSPIHPNRSVRANQWKEVDYDGDGDQDLVVGIGDWTDYGWDDAFDRQGHWTNGPLHGFVYVLINHGSDESPRYDDPRKLEADGQPIDVYGMPSPNFADFDGDGDLDLVCGEFLDGLNYFENVGTRSAPRYAAIRPLEYKGRAIRMELCMIVPVAVDWDHDGDVDLVVGQEDGRVALVEHTGSVVEGVPQFLPPKFFQQQAAEVKVGALATPAACDWDHDGDEDLICGNTAGFLEFVENLGGIPPRWSAPRRLEAGGQVIRIMAGPNGSIQGPCEAKWGYTVPSVADWNGDGRPDIMINSIWGEVLWFENTGTLSLPALRAAQKVEVQWPAKTPKPKWTWWQPKGRQLVTQWRTSPLMIDLNHDGLMDLVMLDQEGYLSFFQRRRTAKQLVLLPGKRIFADAQGRPLRLNNRPAGHSGRRKLVFFDYDHDDRLDLIVSSKPNVDWLRGIGQEGKFVFKRIGPLSERVLAGHSTCPTTIDFDGRGKRTVLVGGEDGFIYRLVE